jgi:O-antigen/teichoic acid export membrane protein
MNNSIPRGVIFGFLSWLLPCALTFVATPIVVKHLGTADYGIYVLVLGVISYTFAFNIGRAIIKYVAEFHATNRDDRINEVLSATLILNLLVGSIGAGILLLLTNDLVTGILQIEPGLHSKAIPSLQLGALTLALWMIGQIFSSVLQALGRFDLFSQITFAISGLQTLGNVALAWADYSVVVLLWWNLLTIVLSGIAFYFAARRLLPGFRLAVFPSREIFLLVCRFSSGVVAYQIIGNLLLIFERAWVTRQLGAESLTFYVVPMMLAFYIHHFVASLTLVLFPLTSEVAAQADKTRLLTIYERTTKYICLLVAFIAVTAMTASREFLSLWLGAEFAERSTWIFVFHIFTYSLIAVGIITWQMADGLGVPKRNVFLSLSWILSAVPLMIWLEPQFGAIGVAAARSISVLSIPVSIFLIEKYAFGRSLKRFWGEILLKLSAAGALCALVEYFGLMNFGQGWSGLILSVFVGAIAFFSVILATRYLTGEERRWFESFMKRAVAARARA